MTFLAVGFLMPLVGISSRQELRSGLINAGLITVFLALSWIVTSAHMRAHTARALGWLPAGRAPTPYERRRTLALALHAVKVDVAAVGPRRRVVRGPQRADRLVDPRGRRRSRRSGSVRRRPARSATCSTSGRCDRSPHRHSCLRPGERRHRACACASAMAWVLGTGVPARRCPRPRRLRCVRVNAAPSVRWGRGPVPGRGRGGRRLHRDDPRRQGDRRSSARGPSRVGADRGG